MPRNVLANPMRCCETLRLRSDAVGGQIEARSCSPSFTTPWSRPSLPAASKTRRFLHAATPRLCRSHLQRRQLSIPDHLVRSVSWHVALETRIRMGMLKYPPCAIASTPNTLIAVLQLERTWICKTSSVASNTSHQTLSLLLVWTTLLRGSQWFAPLPPSSRGHHASSPIPNQPSGRPTAVDPLHIVKT